MTTTIEHSVKRTTVCIQLKRLKNKRASTAGKLSFFGTQIYDRGLCRRGRLQKTRPLALTNAAKATLMLAHIIEKNKCLKSYRTAERWIEKQEKLLTYGLFQKGMTGNISHQNMVLNLLDNENSTHLA